MKSKFLFSVMFLLLIVGFYIPASYSQVGFTASLKNDIYTAPNVYEFDIYMIKTGTTAWRLCAAQFDITFDPAIINGGTITAVELYTISGLDDNGDNIYNPASWSPHNVDYATNGKSNLDWYEPMSMVIGGDDDIQIITKAVSSRDNAKTISSTGDGWCMGRIQLTNTVPFAPASLVHANLAFKFTGYGTIVLGYLGGSGVDLTTDISANGTYVNSALVNPPLPVELTSFVSNVSGRQVNLNWETKTEINSSKYEIDRALVGTKDATITWSSVGSVNAAGMSNIPKKYSYTDKNLQAGKYQYRLKMIDNDGSYKLSAVVETEIAIPKNFELSQNYPNPFNPTTKIDYQVPVDAKVILEVYNIAGQKVVELVNQEQSAGYYTVDFGASKLSSGVYIYRLVASDKATGNNFSSIKKMMLLK